MDPYDDIEYKNTLITPRIPPNIHQLRKVKTVVSVERDVKKARLEQPYRDKVVPHQQTVSYIIRPSNIQSDDWKSIKNTHLEPVNSWSNSSLLTWILRDGA